jgi:hypothetical protein
MCNVYRLHMRSNPGTQPRLTQHSDTLLCCAVLIAGMLCALTAAAAWLIFATYAGRCTDSTGKHNAAFGIFQHAHPPVVCTLWFHLVHGVLALQSFYAVYAQLYICKMHHCPLCTLLLTSQSLLPLLSQHVLLLSCRVAREYNPLHCWRGDRVCTGLWRCWCCHLGRQDSILPLLHR